MDYETRHRERLLKHAGEVIDLIEPPDLLERRDHWRELCRGWAQEYDIA